MTGANRRQRALVVGHIGFDYFIDEDISDLDLKTLEDFTQYTKNLTPYLGGTAGNVAAVMRKIGSLEVDRFSCGDIDGLNKYDKLSPDVGFDVNTNISSSFPEITVPICLIYSKNEEQNVSIYDRTLSVYDAIQKFNQFKNESRKYELLHITTVPPNATLRIINEAREDSPDTIISFAPGQNLHYYYPPLLFDILDKINILFVNNNEMQMLSDIAMENNSDFKSFPDLIVHTRGSLPTKIIQKNDINYINTVKPSKIVDTTGAGDAYSAAFLSDYMVYRDPIKAAKYAAVVASFIVEKQGCQTNIPNWDQINKRMKVWEEPSFSE